MSPFVFFSLQMAVIAYALVSGVFLAFSDFIMRSLAHTGGSRGVDAMQIINHEVFRWVFMTLFIGMAPVSIAIVAYGGAVVGSGPGTMLVLAGLIYLVGCFGVTVVFNVPMNEALAGMDAASTDAQAYWTQTYLPRWTFWNAVRTLASVISATFLLVGLMWMAQSQAHTV
ncbi:MAG: anthrone oxygenase family protein [Pseudomonadota bacterium]